MSSAIGERASARLLLRPSLLAASHASFARAKLSSSATTLNWTRYCSSASLGDHSQRSATEDGKEDRMSRFTTKEKHVDKALMGFIIGKGGSIKAKLENDNGVKLSIASSFEAKTGSSVFIRGSESSVKAASSAIQKILDDAIKSKLQYTHFISLPLALHPVLVQRVENFRESILSSQGAGSSSSSYGDSDGSDLHKSIFINPATIHLTILMLKLWNEERIQIASDVLQKVMPFVHEALEDKPVVLDFQGLECLRGAPEQAHVLYAEIQESRDKRRLLQACQILIDAFVESGLVMERDVDQSLKLHLTLMNTSYRKTQINLELVLSLSFHLRLVVQRVDDFSRARKVHALRILERLLSLIRKQRSSKRIPFDARNIIARYGRQNWGQYAILEAHLSQRFVYDENGYYHRVSAIPFPRRHESSFTRTMKAILF